jgi:hypothetical protein
MLCYRLNSCLGNLSFNFKRSPCSECCIFLLDDSSAYKFRRQGVTQKKEYNLRFICSHEDDSYHTVKKLLSWLCSSFYSASTSVLLFCIIILPLLFSLLPPSSAESLSSISFPLLLLYHHYHLLLYQSSSSSPSPSSSIVGSFCRILIGSLQ